MGFDYCWHRCRTGHGVGEEAGDVARDEARNGDGGWVFVGNLAGRNVSE